MDRTVADTIREITREHLEKNNGLLLGQCITAVGWIQNTVPPHAKGLVELPMADVSGPGIAIGAAIAGRRPMYVLRFQSFLWLAASPIVNYAAKAKEIWNMPVPLFIRAIATEGGGAGPIHTNCFHSLFMHMPGMLVCAPMTPNEYEEVWRTYMAQDGPILVSEHRRSYLSKEEMPDLINRDADITIFPISAARFNTLEAVKLLEAEGIKCNVVHLMWLKPFHLTPRLLEPLQTSGLGLVIDSAYEIAGASQSIAYELMFASGSPVKALGQADRSPGVAARLENGTPTPSKIAETVKHLLRTKNKKQFLPQDSEGKNSVLSHMPRSGVRRITEKVMELEHMGNDVIHLGFGEPQEPTPEPIRRAVSQAGLEGFTKYTLNAGWPELRKAIREKLRIKNGVEVDEEDIFVTPGATYGVSIAISALINSGDEVLVPDPGYPNFAYSALHFGGKVKYYTLQENTGFQIDFKNLDSLVTDKTKLLVINSPSNPTGAVLTEDQMEELVQFTRRRNLWLISDEVYEAFIYSGAHVSPLSFPDNEHVIGIYSFSKTYNMTGLRVGYVVIRDKTLRKSFINAQELYISSAPSVSQVAALSALMECEKDVEQLRKGFQDKRDAALEILKDEVRYVPEGAFYILVDVSRTSLSSDEFADLLLKEKKVAVVPGATFGPSADKFIRIALTAETSLLKEGVRRIKEFIQERTIGSADSELLNQIGI